MFENGDLVKVNGTVGVVGGNFNEDKAVYVLTLRLNLDATKMRRLEKFNNSDLTGISEQEFVTQAKKLAKKLDKKDGLKNGLKGYCTMLKGMKLHKDFIDLLED